MTFANVPQLFSALWASRFKESETRLRFELGGAELDNISQCVPRFLRAHRRASAIADAIFTDACIGIVAWNDRMRDQGDFPGTRNGFEALQSTGFASRELERWIATLYPDPQAPESFHIRSFLITGDKLARDTLLWHAIASDMPISPAAPILAFLIDPDRHVLMHVYDDRGMDVIADDPTSLQDFYGTFADWFLDSDRERMSSAFGKSGFG